jgi:A/G-specific adenine glycosylase
MRVPSALPPPALGAADLLVWYDRHRRVLPWRAPPGRPPHPYRVWLSEIMLQQTTVAAVAPYFARFTARWPDISALAAASLDEVLQEWQGLGYYARARNLHACARAVVERHGGRFPDDPAALRALPGIGAYTAAAIAAIAFGRPVAAVDGNAERVLARLYGVTEPLPAAKTRLAGLAAALVPHDRPGDFAQAVMDLGATICTPQRPRCVLCPWRTGCVATAAGIAETLPARSAKPMRPLRHGVAFWLTRPDGAVLLRRRPERGLLGGMIEIPSTSWRDRPWPLAEAIAAAPASAAWSPLPGAVAHGFTHFRLELAILAGRAEEGDDFLADPVARGLGLWSPIARLGDHALPSLMKKLVRHALSALAAEDYRDVPRPAPSGSSVCAASRTGAKERR